MQRWSMRGWFEMARAEKLLAAMRANPRDWTINDVERLCRSFDLECAAPTRGSHYKVRHPRIDGRLTIPAHKPIKQLYILLLIDLIGKVDRLK